MLSGVPQTVLLHVPLGTHVQSVEPVLMQPDVITQWYRQPAQIAPNRVLQAVQLLVECAEVLFSWVQHASVLVSTQQMGVGGTSWAMAVSNGQHSAAQQHLHQLFNAMQRA